MMDKMMDQMDQMCVRLKKMSLEAQETLRIPEIFADSEAMKKDRL